MFKKFYCVAVDEKKLIDAIRKLNKLDIKIVHLYELAGENVGCWCLGFNANKRNFKSFLTYVRVERIMLKK